MAKKVSLELLKQMLAHAECSAVCSVNPLDRMEAAKRAKLLKARIARRERDEAHASLGLMKGKSALGNTIWE